MTLGAAAYFFAHRTPALTDKDTIVLADFRNTTGDEVFDETVRQGLSVQLEQSPFLRLVSDQAIRKTLGLMGRKADVHLTPDIAREICVRTGAAAVLEGSIAALGTQYVLGLRANFSAVTYCFVAVHVPLPLNAGHAPLGGVENVNAPDALVAELKLPETVGKFDVPLGTVNALPVIGAVAGRFEQEAVPSGQLAVTVHPPLDPMISPPTAVTAFAATTK